MNFRSNGHVYKLKLDLFIYLITVGSRGVQAVETRRPGRAAGHHLRPDEQQVLKNRFRNKSENKPTLRNIKKQ